MNEHPSIAANINTGYLYPEPDLHSNCIHCGPEIFVGEDVFTAGHDYCSIICFAELALSEGNHERRIAGE